MAKRTGRRGGAVNAAAAAPKRGALAPHELPVSELKAIVARFEQRTRDAQRANGPTKEKVKWAIKRQGIDKVDPVYILTQDAEWTNERETRWAHSAGGTGAHQMRFPIEDWSQLDDYIATRMPRADAPGRFDQVPAEMDMHRASKYLLGRIGLLLFERLNCLRGVERHAMRLEPLPRGTRGPGTRRP